MLSLQEQQEALRDILRGRPVDTRQDAWLAEVSQSPGLAIIRETIAWWQRFQIEMQCRYTSRLLKRKGVFTEAVAFCFSASPAAPSIEELAAQFLTWASTNEDSLLRAVAAFELACLVQNSAGAQPRSIEWDRSPTNALLALEESIEMPAPESGVRYVMHIGPDPRVGMTCVREPLPITAPQPIP